MKYLKVFEEFIENSDNVIDAKMQELKDLIDGLSDESIVYEWQNKSDHEIVVNFTKGDLGIRYEFDIDQMYVAKFVGQDTDFHTTVESIDEGIDIIEKDIHGILGISERAKAQRYKGRKIPGKYLTKNPGKMKKEIDTFRGKNIYKKDWDADYKSGKGGKGKRVKTKKSAATKAYHRMFGDKEK